MPFVIMRVGVAPRAYPAMPEQNEVDRWLCEQCHKSGGQFQADSTVVAEISAERMKQVIAAYEEEAR